MAESKIPIDTVVTTAGRDARLTVTSHDQAVSLIIQPKTMTNLTPAIEMDISSVNGSITIYANTGSGWNYIRSF